ncbi:MAG: hypothetical protein Q8P67_12475, partial [archaeon]|nr:hypothetical protein [archaeon]
VLVLVLFQKGYEAVLLVVLPRSMMRRKKRWLAWWDDPKPLHLQDSRCGIVVEMKGNLPEGLSKSQADPSSSVFQKQLGQEEEVGDGQVENKRAIIFCTPSHILGFSLFRFFISGVLFIVQHFDSSSTPDPSPSRFVFLLRGFRIEQIHAWRTGIV